MEFEAVRDGAAGARGHGGTERSWADAQIRPFARVLSKWTDFDYIEVLVTHVSR